MDTLEFDCVCAGFAGAGDPGSLARAESVIQEVFTPALLRVVGDMEIALEAAVGGGPGVVLISGTGSIAYGRNASGEAARAGGQGSDGGDPGSGFAIGYAAVSAVVDGAADGPTDEELAAALRSELGKTATHALRELLERREASELAALTPVVQRAFEAGSAAAAAILKSAGNDLARTAGKVIEVLKLSPEGSPAFACGGAFTASPELGRTADAALRDTVPGWALADLTVSPAEGAVRMGRRLWRERAAAK